MEKLLWRKKNGITIDIFCYVLYERWNKEISTFGDFEILNTLLK